MANIRDLIREIILEGNGDVAEDEDESPVVDSLEKDIEIEKIVDQVKQKLFDNNIAGENGLLQMIDNKDEFEDLVRFIFDHVGFRNDQLGLIAMSIAKDFLDNPETAAQMSKFNL